jgi:hypothetical protein
MLEHLHSSKERKEIKQTAKRSIHDKQRQDKRIYLRKLSQPLGTQHIQCPRRRISSSVPGKRRTRKSIDYTRKVSQGHLLTSSGETADPWASRETSASLDFFDRLVLWVTGIFLTEALVVLGAYTAGSTSCAEGSSGVTA